MIHLMNFPNDQVQPFSALQYGAKPNQEHETPL
jgi:hypothetical protein